MMIRRFAIGILVLWLSSFPSFAEPDIRVVTLAPSLTEMMVELDAGDLLVGILDHGERPAGLEQVPSIGKYGRFSLERMIQVRPRLVLAWTGTLFSAQERRLKELGYQVFYIEPATFEELAQSFEKLGKILGRDERGRAVAAMIRRDTEQLRNQYRQQEPLKVFYQVWDRPLYTLGGRQIVSEALEICGAQNLFADLELPAPQVNQETVIIRNPDVILAPSRRQLERWKRWPKLSAVRNDRLLLIPDLQLERPSLGMLKATQKLCALLHPDITK